LDHHVLHIATADKNDTAAHIAARDGRVLMFVGTKHRADRLTRQLRASGVNAAALHGGKSQPQRTRALDGFRDGSVKTLVATSLAARGIHVDDVDLVVNIDPPTTAKDYLHRGGRTARAGRAGRVVTLVLPEERRETARLLTEAGVNARSAEVRPGDPVLGQITGARAPSGIPLAPPLEHEVAGRPSLPSRSAGSSSRRRFSNQQNARPYKRRSA
jgi:superfamily II DNA/RNA helicase